MDENESISDNLEDEMQQVFSSSKVLHRISSNNTPSNSTSSISKVTILQKGTINSKRGMSDPSDVLDLESAIPVRYHFVKTLPEYEEILQKDVLKKAIKFTDKNFKYYQENVRFFQDLDKRLVNTKNVTYIREVKVDETDEYTTNLGSNAFSITVKSVLYKLIPLSNSKRYLKNFNSILLSKNNNSYFQ